MSTKVKKIVKTKKTIKPMKKTKTKIQQKTNVKKKALSIVKKVQKATKKVEIKKMTTKNTSAKKTTVKGIKKVMVTKTPTTKTAPTTEKSKTQKASSKRVEVKSPVVKKTVKKIIEPEVSKLSEPKALKTPKKTEIKVSEAMQSADVTVASQILGLSAIEPYQPKKNEEYMSEEMQAHFRKILQAWKRQLMEEVDRTVHHMKDEAANFPDPSDRATQEEEFNLELRARDRERKLIKKIDEALSMITEDAYGYCDACGVEIGLRRLEARPTANLCIDCKTLDEIREKQQGS